MPEPAASSSPAASAGMSQTTGRFRWVICALLFFSTTCNYMDRQVISYLKQYFCAPLESSSTFSTFSPSDIVFPKFVARLKGSDAVTTYIKSNLSPATLSALQSDPEGGTPALQTNLVHDLNALINGGSMYEPGRFASVTLRPGTQQLLAQNPSRDALPHFNRLLIDDAYPRAISRGGFGWSNTDFGNLTSFFTAFYAGMTIIAGWVIDKIGTKIGLALSLITWSIFGIANAFVGRLVSMHIFIRSAFAIGEAGNFPASIKTVAEWFPKRERALATAIFNSGSNAGAMVAALLVPAIMIEFGDALGWKWAFIITGLLGFPWLIFWSWLYNPPSKSPRVRKAELNYIHIDDETAVDAQTGDKAKVSWWKLFRYRQLWAFFSGKFMTDGIWWFYLFWLPDYLIKQFHMTKEQVMLPTFAVYGVAIIGSIYGGSIPMTLIKRGMPVYKARMTTMFIIAVLPLAVLFTQYFGDVKHFGHSAAFLAVSMICIGATAHQAWSANLFTTVSDMFPKKTIASIVGIGTAAGGIGGVIVQKIAGNLTDRFKETPDKAYLIMFVICALSYLIAWAIMKALVPRHEPITDL
jgi:ACS family hexuronate transporter-like MFS transporter